MSDRPTFTGDRKVPLVSPTAAIEAKLINALLPHFPKWIQGNHLTWMTLLWSIGVILAGYLARINIHWLWLSSAMLFLQWFTDSFDGRLGKLRGLGAKRWGYYMDHFLDYIFMACVTGHYAFIMPNGDAIWFLLLVPLYAAFEVNAWLDFGATGEFRITYLFIGPTELRLIFILLNTAIIYTGVAWLITAMPWTLGVLCIALVGIVYRTQKRIWQMDMDAKGEEEAS